MERLSFAKFISGREKAVTRVSSAKFMSGREKVVTESICQVHV